MKCLVHSEQFWKMQWITTKIIRRKRGSKILSEFGIDMNEDEIKIKRKGVKIQ